MDLFRFDDLDVDFRPLGQSDSAVNYDLTILHATCEHHVYLSPFRAAMPESSTNSRVPLHYTRKFSFSNRANSRCGLAAAEQKIEELKQEIEEKVSNLDVKYRAAFLNSGIEEVLVRPRKTDIAVRTLALVWMPCYLDTTGNVKPAI